MAEVTKIQWTNHTFNPWIGCTKVHTGCLNCYAEADMDKRRGRAKWGPNGTRSRTSDAYWREPLKWEREAAKEGVRRRVFCASLADVFEDWQGPILNSHGQRISHLEGACEIVATMNDLRSALFCLIDSTPNLDWLLLTKRPENIQRMLLSCAGNGRKNIWLGTSVSDQATADKAVPELLKCRDLAPVLFLSIEPMVGPVDLTQIDTGKTWAFKGETSKLNALRGYTSSRRRRFVLNGIVEEKGEIPFVDTEGEGSIDWVIVGGESGPNARPCNPTLVKDIVDQCRKAGVACFVKQLGANVVHWEHPVALKDKKGGEPSEWPEDLRIREFPEVSLT